MAAHRLSSALVLGIALTCSIQLPAPCFAQDNLNADANVQPADCPTLTIFPQLAATVVLSCDKGDSVEVSMPLKPDKLAPDSAISSGAGIQAFSLVCASIFPSVNRSRHHTKYK